MNKVLIVSFAMLTLTTFADFASADPTTRPSSSQPQSNTDHYGLFGLLDDRSMLGTGFFPEPFLVDEGDTDRELAFTWAHMEGHGAVTDQVTSEVEYAFGLTTIELELPYERDTFQAVNPLRLVEENIRTEGIDPIQISVRHPIWQWVSSDEKIDNSVVLGGELAIPTNSQVGHTTELVPQLFDLLRIGDHFGLQTHVGYSTLLGEIPPNKQTLEYSADFSYQLNDTDIPPLPHVGAIVPMFELAGERGLNDGDTADDLTGVLGGRVNLDAVGPLSPRLGFGYVLPVDRQAHHDFSSGFVASFVFDF